MSLRINIGYRKTEGCSKAERPRKAERYRKAKRVIGRLNNVGKAGCYSCRSCIYEPVGSRKSCIIGSRRSCIRRRLNGRLRVVGKLNVVVAEAVSTR